MRRYFPRNNVNFPSRSPGSNQSSKRFDPTSPHFPPELGVPVREARRGDLSALGLSALRLEGNGHKSGRLGDFVAFCRQLRTGPCVVVRSALTAYSRKTYTYIHRWCHTWRRATLIVPVAATPVLARPSHCGGIDAMAGQDVRAAAAPAPTSAPAPVRAPVGIRAAVPLPSPASTPAGVRGAAVVPAASTNVRPLSPPASEQPPLPAPSPPPPVPPGARAPQPTPAIGPITSPSPA